VEKTLVMVFKNADGKNASISIAAPREDLDAVEVVQAMQEIIDNNVFVTSGGDLVEIAAARVVSREVTELEVV
jgi:aromatic ring-opening dioxygenase catalytic subunit (LigB family)